MLPVAKQAKALASLGPAELDALLYDWRFWARQSQLAPAGDWSTWLIMAGRGFGKTRSGAEWVREQVDAGERVIHLIGATAKDVREIMVLGDNESPGLLNVFPHHQRPLYKPSRGFIRFHTGAIGRTFSAEKPDQLRGPQCAKAWGDEPAKWMRAAAVWDNLQLGLRKGENPQACLTTTPRPIPFLRDLIKDPTTKLTTGTMQENRANLAAKFIRIVEAKYKGTRLEKQELQGLLLEDVEGALWTLALIEAGRMGWAPKLQRIVVGVDPTVAGKDTISQGKSDEAGIVVAGVARDLQKYVLADRTLRGEPKKWAYEAVAAYHEFKADCIVAEMNNGGEMVRDTIKAIDPTVPVVLVSASRGKYTRAQPQALEYDQGKVHHVGIFTELEDEMVSWDHRDTNASSPNRIDALVWALYGLTADLSTASVTLL